MPEGTGLRVSVDSLKAFCVRVLEALDVPDEDSRIVADVLVAADRRGVDSHGVARLRRYVAGLQHGTMLTHPDVRVVTETPATALIDAGAGLGHPVSYRAMQRAIQKAQDYGAGFVTVRNSNHFGIAGYYAMMALAHDCIGICLTNATPLVVPTFGQAPMLGTNPIALAAPAEQEYPFVLDMATSTVPMGKLEVYGRLEKPVPEGWAVDESGAPLADAGQAMAQARLGTGGGILPLGGSGESLGGHKGYGLALLVEVLTAVLSGAAYSRLIPPRPPGTERSPANLGHFFGAWRVEAFRPAAEFKADMDSLQRLLKGTRRIAGEDRIYVHGEKEYETTERRTRDGIPLIPNVVADLRSIADELGVEPVA